MNTVLENIIEVFENRNTPDSEVKVSFILSILKTYLEEEKEMMMQCGTAGANRFSQAFLSRLTVGEIGELVYEQFKKY
jgi:hypothetical protein